MAEKYPEIYIFPAVFERTVKGSYGISFPDLPGCISMGDTLQEAHKMAKEALGLHLYGMEHDDDDIPEPSSLESIQLEVNETLGLIEVWMLPVRAELDNRAVKKTLTIPHYLNELAEKKKVNFSQILQSALKDHLGIHR
jgi:predicted RNase H-like HicB family nuclease